MTVMEFIVSIMIIIGVAGVLLYLIINEPRTRGGE